MLNLTQGDWLRFDMGQNWHSLSKRRPATVLEFGLDGAPRCLSFVALTLSKLGLVWEVVRRHELGCWTRGGNTDSQGYPSLLEQPHLASLIDRRASQLGS